MSKQRRTQLWAEFISDLICLMLSHSLSFLIFKYVYIKIYDFTIWEWTQYVGLLAASYLVTYICFHFNIDFEHRGKTKELVNIFKNSTITFMLFAMLLLLAKNPIINCRYLFVFAFIFFIITCAGARYHLKRIMTNHFSSTKNASIVAVSYTHLTLPTKA